MPEDPAAIFDRYEQAFSEAETRLREKRWFSSNWHLRREIVQGKKGPTGIAQFMYKTNWFNAERPGIYFDAAVRASQHKSQELAVLMLVRTSKARTGFSANEFHALLKERCGKLIESWSDYRLHPTWGAQPIRGDVSFTPDSVSEVVSAELDRMSELAKPIDEIIDQIGS